MHMNHSCGIIRDARRSLAISGWILIALFVVNMSGCGDVPDGSDDPATNALGEGRAESGDRTIPFRFSDVTARIGMDMILTSGESPSTELLEVKKGGLALIDYNNNGRWDLFVANGATLEDPEHGPSWRLYENLGDLRFRNVTEQAGIIQTRWAMGACVGDVTGNGFDDIYVTCFGPNVLLRNNGDGTFTDFTDQANVGDGRWGTTCAFGDVAGDGHLDLYVANYMEFDIGNPPPRGVHKGVEVMGGPFGVTPEHDVLYRNDGEGTFTDITEDANCVPREPAYGLNVAILDVNDNGLQDIYVGNDSTPNFLFVNQGDGTFEERGMRSGIATNAHGHQQATMGVAIGDVNGNGLPDFFTTNFSNDTNTLHVNLDGEYFEDQTQLYGLGIVSRLYLGWTAAFYDFNHDGREELFFVNGHIYPQATIELMDSEYEQPPLLFRRGNNRFERVTDPAVGDWLVTPRRDRPAVFADLDEDGDIDMIIAEINGPVRVLRNDGADGPWCIIELNDDREGVGNRRALGSRVQITDGDTTHSRWIISGASYQSSNPPFAHFGLKHQHDELNVRITWPDGQKTIATVPMNERTIIKRSETRESD